MQRKESSHAAENTSDEDDSDEDSDEDFSKSSHEPVNYVNNNLSYIVIKNLSGKKMRKELMRFRKENAKLNRDLRGMRKKISLFVSCLPNKTLKHVHSS